ncbi:MAG: M23 family metallopeptidase [Acidobacteriaceae bacterium]|nr:M23 family metallopeptidase [Acidobacteriaceae bacterium]
MRKRYYLLLVSRDAEGQLRKIPIPLHYLYVFLAGALIGMFSITGIAGSYTRMVMKVARFNQLRNEKEALKDRYSRLEKVAQEKDIQVASLGSLAGEVSALYGLKTEPVFKTTAKQGLDDEDFVRSIDQLYALKTSALTGAATIGIEFGPNHNATTADWLRLAAAPTLWPVEGMVTGSFGERVDPFNGEGAFHTGVDISTAYGRPVVAPADGVVTYAETLAGYGRLVMIEHGQGISTRYGHLANYTVAPGQSVHRGDVIGYVGMTGRSTGPHLHYEVRIHDVPVNPYKYLRMTIAQGMEMQPPGF